MRAGARRSARWPSPWAWHAPAPRTAPFRTAGTRGASGSRRTLEWSFAGDPGDTRSPAGLPLGKPPLALDLSGVDDPVQATFRSPPRAGLLFDLTPAACCGSCNPLQRLHMASLTKMMTALRVVHSTTPDTPVLITKEAVDTPGSKVGVLPLGKHVSAETLLYGLLLPSGNDAAVALAQHVSGSVSAFVDEHERGSGATRAGLHALQLPLRATINARNYTCAADLAELAHVDLQQPRIAHIVRSAEAVLPFPIKGGKLYLYNNNPLLVYGYPGTTGMKTGYTELAGDCLVGDRRARRREARRGAAALPRHGPAGRVPAQRRLRPGLPPAADRLADRCRRVAEGVALCSSQIDWPVSQRESNVDLDDTPEQAAHRARVRAWLEQHKGEAPVPHRTRRADRRGGDRLRQARLAGQARRGRACRGRPGPRSTAARASGRSSR